MKNLFIISLLLLTGCSVMTTEQSAMWQATNNFTYKGELPGKDEWITYDSINEPFTGDCEDYALTLQKQIGGDVWYVVLPGKRAHAVLAKNGIAYDFRFKRSIKVESYPGRFSHIMN
jgi:hypothetical protein